MATEVDRDSGEPPPRHVRSASWPAVTVAVINLVLSAAAPSRAGDTIKIDNATTWSSPAVLYDGQVDGACHKDLVFSGASFDLGDVGTDGHCPPQVTIFTRDFGALMVTRPWGTQGTVGEYLPLKVPPRPRLRVQVYVVGDEDLDLGYGITEATDAAQAVFEEQRTGIALVFPDIIWVSPGSDSALRIGQGCDNALGLRTTLPVLARPWLNVFFVTGMKIGTMTGLRGYDCAVTLDGASGNLYDYDAQNVIYVDTAKFLPATVAHEIGHALGLLTPEKTLWGHTTGQPGFTSDNLMWDGSNSVDQISLGQSYRMNFDARSWLNRPLRLVRPRRFRVCASDVTYWWECPPLALDLPAGGGS